MSLRDIEFQWSGADVDYRYEYDCANSGCDDEGICRCGTIHDEVVCSVDISAMTQKIYEEFFEQGKAAERNDAINKVLYGIGKDIDIYCIDRILRSRKVWEPQSWHIEISGGYYGQEIGPVYLKEHIADEIEDLMHEAFALGTLKEKVEFLLKLEYGKVLPELKGCRYEYETIEISEVIFGSEGHLNRVKNKALDFYSDRSYRGIRGIVKRSGEKLRVIDGYHRISTTKFPKAMVLVAYDK